VVAVSIFITRYTFSGIFRKVQMKYHTQPFLQSGISLSCLFLVRNVEFLTFPSPGVASFVTLCLDLQFTQLIVRTLLDLLLITTLGIVILKTAVRF